MKNPFSVNNSLKDASGWTSLISFVILLLTWIIGFSTRLFSVIRFESIIHEFDPWFNYRSTQHMVENGFYNFLNWFDDTAWYPLGRIVGGTVYPGLMVTSGAIHYFLNLLNIPIHIREICVFLAPSFSGLTAMATYLLTKELWTPGAGLFAACFISIVPGYISRSVAGSYDNEGIAIFALMFTYFLWIKSVKLGSIMWSTFCALSYFYMVSAWGGYVFIINLIPLHVLVLLLMQRYSARLYVSYTCFFVLGLILSMQIPFVGFQPVRTNEHMASAGVFVLLQAYAFLRYLRANLPFAHIKQFFYAAVCLSGALVFAVIVILTYSGYIAPWSGRFYSLWDTAYAKIHIPIIASVSEHQPTTWVSFVFDLHVLACIYPVGLWFCFKELNDERVFIILYAITASYFAGVMIRLILTLTPVVCVLSAIAFSKVMNIYLVDNANANSELTDYNDGEVVNSSNHTDKPDGQKLFYDKPSKKLASGDGASSISGNISANATAGNGSLSTDEFVGFSVRTIVLAVFMILLLFFVLHCTWVTSNAYSSPSVVLASYTNKGDRIILDDFREAYHWLRQNTHEKARVMSWWDYGYQIAGMANRTTLVDNNTWNNSHIALVGKAMASNESEALKIMHALDVDYILIIFGGVIGYSGDDINKFLWMVRIAEGEHPNDIRESDYFSENGEYRVDSRGSKIMLNSLMYKMSYYRFGEVQMDYHTPAGFDRTRNYEIGRKNFDLEYLEEAYTTENWLVRIYKVKDDDNTIGRSRKSLHRRQKRFNSKKTIGKKAGSIKNKVVVNKGKQAKSK